MQLPQEQFNARGLDVQDDLLAGKCGVCSVCSLSHCLALCQPPFHSTHLHGRDVRLPHCTDDDMIPIARLAMPGDINAAQRHMPALKQTDGLSSEQTPSSLVAGKDLEAMTTFFMKQLRLKDPVKSALAFHDQGIVSLKSWASKTEEERIKVRPLCGRHRKATWMHVPLCTHPHAHTHTHRAHIHCGYVSFSCNVRHLSDA